ncbi:alpha/beta fold hydrolase [Arthrobacter sp. NPDC056727]|uniref:alpha/beta fold hydrolase n=1 Tax=Arthrobacter sp. NPDC056727 TaxID=3345927 RepID=UPI003670E75F
MLNGMFDVEGASLYYEVRGRGPAVLLIAGAGGDAGHFSALAAALSDAFTVITYDRRGNSRSSGRVARPMKMSDQSNDAAALIRGLAGDKALVFGNSGGAIVGMDLAARHPDVVRGLVAHEPPAVRVLPKEDPWHHFFDHIAAQFREYGLGYAAREFAATVKGGGMMPGDPELYQRLGGNWDFMFRWEWGTWGDFVPDVRALAGAQFPIVLGAGSADRGLYYARPSVEIAKRIGASWAEFPGTHLEFMANGALFGAALRTLLTQMYVRTEGMPDEWAQGPNARI